MPRRHTQEEVIAMFRAAHGDKYDYSQVEYVNLATKVKIICPIHGMFEQRAQMHAQGQECPKCAMDTRKKTCLERYGIELPILSEAGRAKKLAVCRERYGGDSCMCSPEVQAKAKVTRQQRYGVDAIAHIPGVRDKIIATNMERYGCECSFQNEAVKAKYRENCLRKYGVTNTLVVPEIVEQRKQTLLAHYGVDNPMKSDVIRKRASDTLEARYGARYTFSVPEIVAKAWRSQRAHGTYRHSNAEDTLYELLVAQFGEGDVIRQYRSEKYPFRCDFYVVSRDMYIELNGFFTHGGHWFDKTCQEDLDKLAMWQEGSLEHSYYQGAIEGWCERDVAKRAAARAANLNYVVFWDWRLRDAKMWFDLGCPDGHDWLEEYSWVSSESLDV